MESSQKFPIHQELRSTRELTLKLNEQSIQEDIQVEKFIGSIQRFYLSSSTPLKESSIRDSMVLRRQRSLELSVKVDVKYQQTEKWINSIFENQKGKIISVKFNQNKLVSELVDVKSNQRWKLTQLEEKRKNHEKRKIEKINFINDQINKLQNINERLNSIKDSIWTQLSEKSQQPPKIPKQYFVSDLFRLKAEGNLTIQKNSAHFSHFKKNLNILRQLQNKHQLLTCPPACAKTLQTQLNSAFPTLVLDLDETLIWTQKTEKTICMNSVYLKDKLSRRNVRHEVYLRPFVDKFLEEASKMYEIVVFTAATFEYTNQIIKMLDPRRKLISRVLTREYATKFSDGMYEVYVKDLRVLNSNLDRTVFVDNSMYSYALQLENGIPILSFNGDPTDNVLEDLLAYLKELGEFNNLKERNEEVMKQSRFESFLNKNSSVQEIVEFLYKEDEILRRSCCNSRRW